MIMEFL